MRYSPKKTPISWCFNTQCPRRPQKKGRHRDEKRVSTQQAFCGDTWKNSRLLADVLHGNKKSWRPATNIHKRKHAKTAMEGPIFPQPCGYGLDWLDSWPTQGWRGIHYSTTGVVSLNHVGMIKNQHVAFLGTKWAEEILYLGCCHFICDAALIVYPS